MNLISLRMSDAGPEAFVRYSTEATGVLETVGTAAWRSARIERIPSSKDVTINKYDVGESVLVAHGRAVHGILKWPALESK